MIVTRKADYEQFGLFCDSLNDENQYEQSVDIDRVVENSSAARVQGGRKLEILSDMIIIVLNALWVFPLLKD